MGKRGAENYVTQSNFKDEDPSKDEPGSFKIASPTLMSKRPIAKPRTKKNQNANVHLSIPEFMSQTTPFSFGKTSFASVNPFASLGTPSTIPHAIPPVENIQNSTNDPSVSESSPSSSNTLLMLAKEVRGLNHYFSLAITSHMSSDPLTDLTPLLQEYTAFMTVLKTKYDAAMHEKLKNVTNTQEKFKSPENKSPVKYNQSTANHSGALFNLASPDKNKASVSGDSTTQSTEKISFTYGPPLATSSESREITESSKSPKKESQPNLFSFSKKSKVEDETEPLSFANKFPAKKTESKPSLFSFGSKSPAQEVEQKPLLFSFASKIPAQESEKNSVSFSSVNNLPAQETEDKPLSFSFAGKSPSLETGNKTAPFSFTSKPPRQETENKLAPFSFLNKAPSQDIDSKPGKFSFSTNPSTTDTNAPTFNITNPSTTDTNAPTFNITNPCTTDTNAPTFNITNTSTTDTNAPTFNITNPSISSSSQSSFGSASTFGSGFGASTNTTLSNPFTFSNTSSQQGTLFNPPLSTTFTQNNVDDEKETQEEIDRAQQESKATEQSIAQLMKTAEEGEECCYSVKCKVSQLNKTWKDVGLGAFSLLKNLESGKKRIVLRADGSGRVLLNMACFKDMNVKLEGEKRFTFIGVLDGKPFKFLVKVKTDDIAKATVDALTEHIKE